MCINGKKFLRLLRMLVQKVEIQKCDQIFMHKKTHSPMLGHISLSYIHTYIRMYVHTYKGVGRCNIHCKLTGTATVAPTMYVRTYANGRYVLMYVKTLRSK